MPVQTFTGLSTEPPLVSQTAVVATSEEALFPVTPYTLIPSADVRAGKQWHLKAAGIMSFASTGTLILTPRYGTSTAGIT